MKLMVLALAACVAFAAQAAAPTESASQVTQDSDTGNGVTISLPAASAGDYRICFGGIASQTGIDVAPSGFTELLNDTDSYAGSAEGFDHRSLIYYRAFVGGDASTASFQTSGSVAAVFWCVTVTGATGVPTISTVTHGIYDDTVNPNPPNFAPGGTTDRLYYAAVFLGSDGLTTSAVPSGYANGHSSDTGSGNGNIGSTVSIASKAGTSPEDPGTFTISAPRDYAVLTLQIPGTSAATITPKIVHHRNQQLSEE